MCRCTVCNDWYGTDDHERTYTCRPCADLNFAGNPLEAPTAREALHAYVDAAGPYTLTPRQVEAMRRMAERWQEEDRHDL